jgi:uncharacterized protein (DUF58 family)
VLRRLQFIVLALVLVVAAFSTGAVFLFFLLYLGVLVIGGSYVLTRFGLADLEAGHVLDRLHGEVGDVLRASYTVRNISRLPKLWLEVHNPTTLPTPLPGRALALGSRSERSWVTYVQLTRRGHFRVDPLLLRAADPFGLFESYATVGRTSTVIVYPRIESIPNWHLPPAAIEGAHAHAVRTMQTTPHATSIRPYAPGDAYNRIHWKSSARQGELQVKEFDLEQTADVWLFIDLEAGVHVGEGDESTIEYAVRAAAAIAARALIENRSVGITASGARRAVLPPDRGRRQYQKMMQLLAAVQADGREPLVDVLVEGSTRLRRGMTAVVITPSIERDWVKPLSTVQPRGVVPLVVRPEAWKFEEARRLAMSLPARSAEELDAAMRASRAVQHALAEYDLLATVLQPGRSLTEQLATPRSSRTMAIAR